MSETKSETKTDKKPVQVHFSVTEIEALDVMARHRGISRTKLVDGMVHAAWAKQQMWCTKARHTMPQDGYCPMCGEKARDAGSEA